MTDDCDVEGDIARLTADHTPEIRAIEEALRRAIKAEFPDVLERVDSGNKLIAYGRSMKMRDLAFALIAHRDHVNLQLADGVDLPDPARIVEGTGKRIRHVKVRTVEAARSRAARSRAARSRAVRDLIRAQIASKT